MKLLLILPILIPVLTAAFCILAWKSRVIQRWLSLAGVCALLVSTFLLLRTVNADGIQVVQLGNWPAPFGITLVADLFSGLMLTVTAFIGVCVGVFALVNLDGEREKFGFYPLYQILLMGVCGAFLTGDLFNLFVWFEVMLMTSFVLLALGGERAQIEGAVKYLTLNFIASGLFLTTIGILYGKFGTLNMADLALRVQSEPAGVGLSSSLLLFVAFGIKAGVFPLFFWLPASYHTPPAAVSAIFAGLLTKVGVYAMIRAFTLIFTFDTQITHGLIILVSVFTMITGVLGAAAQQDIRRILSFHIISQIGYMTLGLGLFTTAALAASIFYIIHHIIVKTNLFLIGGVVEHIYGSEKLKQVGGLYQHYPLIAALFLIPAMSLAGIPPLSGFFAKLSLIRSGIEVQSYLPIAAALIVGLLTLFSMTKIWSEAFWKADPEAGKKAGRVAVPMLMVLPIVAMAAVTVWIGLFPGVLMSIGSRAAEQLMNPNEYVRAVLGVTP
jgi:multicomponent Na+:H+ antiporter subunit D